jgi:hypothetical protein
MACCDNHDRLDKILHTEEYLGMRCGEHKVNTVVVDGTHLVSPDAEKQTQPHYCCFNCPTLAADKGLV